MGNSMDQYEIRLRNGLGALALQVSQNYCSDDAAIHLAEHLRKTGQAIEVWRGDERIYYDSPPEGELFQFAPECWHQRAA
jgi:hypothetical protein